jgi:hypothetical protein
VEGPARFAQTMQPAIEAAGGELRLGADVRQMQRPVWRRNDVMVRSLGLSIPGRAPMRTPVHSVLENDVEDTDDPPERGTRDASGT